MIFISGCGVDGPPVPPPGSEIPPLQSLYTKPVAQAIDDEEEKKEEQKKKEKQ